MCPSPFQIWGGECAGSCVRRASSRILEDVSRRRNQRAQPPHAPTVTGTDDFSDQELDFFRRGDELHPPATDTNEAPDSDA